ncbi:hypothetical protein V865_007781 [Kwoniella europaea PYCC6329]|uniref:HIG1 domain-containing protein n=1 Tax=Kwoniella europaea PYCC6329 TaxID=1423913 RepID=A0AAX4KWC9_9TREE
MSSSQSPSQSAMSEGTANSSRQSAHWSSLTLNNTFSGQVIHRMTAAAYLIKSFEEKSRRILNPARPKLAVTIATAGAIAGITKLLK